MAKILYDQAAQNAQRSHDALITHLENKPWNDPIFKLIANALIDTRIEGFLSGMDLVSDNVQLDAYSRGYADGLEDKK
jgi:hypothetical protein